MILLEGVNNVMDEAQYAQAVIDRKLSPLASFQFPSNNDLTTYLSQLESTDPSSLTLAGMCKQPLGLYMFSKFLNENPRTRQLGLFLLDIAAYQNFPEHHEHAASFTHHMIEKYFQHSMTPSDQPFLPFSSSLSCSFPISNGSTSDKNEKIVISFSRSASVGTIRDNETSAGKDEDDRIFVENVDLTYLTRQEILRIGQRIFYKIEECYLRAFYSSIAYVTYLRFKYIVEQMAANSEDYLLICLVGRGGFGKVFAARNVYTGKLVAIKIMTKKRIKYYDALKVCLDEKALLASVQSPYVLSLLCSFHTNEDVSLVCDLLTGGSLDYHLRKSPFSVPAAKYYSARVILALAALHSQQIVYRDLKPQNIMLDENGRSKLVDLGLASHMPPEGLVGKCGTRGYWAPEMIARDTLGRRLPYSFCVDWFSLGCCIYEFLTSQCLFYSPQVQRFHEKEAATIEEAHRQQMAVMQNNLPSHPHRHGQPSGQHHPSVDDSSRKKHRAIDYAIQHMKVDLSGIADEQAVDLIEKLLAKDPTQRLGYRGVREIMAHPWFNTIDWKRMDTCESPFTPGHASNICLVSEIGEFPDADKVEKTVLTEADQRSFDSWPYMNRTVLQQEVVEYLAEQYVQGNYRFSQPVSSCCVLQ